MAVREVFLSHPGCRSGAQQNAHHIYRIGWLLTLWVLKMPVKVKRSERSREEPKIEGGVCNNLTLSLASPSMSFASEPSPFDDPHRDSSIPPWPTTPHSPTDPHPTLVKSAQPAQPPSPLPSAGLQGPPTGPWGKEPQIYGQPSPGLISPRETKSSDGTQFEKPEPYLRVRITALDRNRRDILIRFDAQVNTLIIVTCSRADTSGIYELDKPYEFYGNNIS